MPSPNKELGLKACEYSRSQIREGQTQLQNNKYNFEKK